MKDAPATKGDLDTLRADLRGEIQASAAELRNEMLQMEKRLVREIGAAISHALGVALEKLGDLVTLVDERYKDLPEKTASLRSDLDDHVANRAIHHAAKH